MNATSAKEPQRRTDVVGIFPNEAAIERLVGVVLEVSQDADLEWLMGAILDTCAKPVIPPPKTPAHLRQGALK